MNEEKPQETARTPVRALPDLEALKKKLERGELDLRVEEVEERIAPSETNVFDK